jgi:hypothetical protein
MLTGPPRDVDPVAEWRAVMALFGRSAPRSTPSVVLGGWSHSVWRVDTNDGTYAIKEMREGRGAWWIDKLNTATTFELAAWNTGTVSMAEPIPVASGEGLLGRLEAGHAHRWYRCHRWLDAKPCLGEEPDPARSARVGTIVAALADLGVQKGSTADQLEWNALDAYDDTVAEATAKGLDWAPDLADLRPHVDRLRHDFADLARRAIPLSVTHRDIDPKNTARHTNGDVALFDWDNAGPRLIESELLDAALSFAGDGLHIDEACVLATLDASVDATGRRHDFAYAPTTLVESGFRWIMLNAWRSLGHRDVTPEQQAFAGSMVTTLAGRWPVEAELLRQWATRAGSR